MQQQSRLQEAETELSVWEKALVEHELELQKRIDQELGEKFSEEAKDCRKWRERLQACRNKMRECRGELTKSHRQLWKCKEKLTECEVSLKRCRGELGNSHSQITECIEGIKNKSQKLSEEIKTLTVTAGGALGGAGGAGVGALLVGCSFGPAGLLAAALIGGGIGLVSGGVGGAAVADVWENNLEEARKKLRGCEEELSDCGDVVERCREALQKSEDELKDLRESVRELEHFIFS